MAPAPAPATTAPAAVVPTPAIRLPALAVDPGGATGKPRWTVGFGGIGTDAPRGLAIDDRNAIFVAGLFSAEANFGTLGSRTAIGKTDAMVLALDEGGAPTWIVPFGGSGEDVANAVAQRGQRVLAVGNFADKIAVQGTDRAPALAGKSAGSDDLFAICLDRTGAAQWVWTAGGIDSDGANAVAAAPDGWIVGGSFSRRAQFGSTEFESRGRTDAVLVKLSDDGEVIWAKQFGGRYADSILRVAVDPAGNVFVQGIFADVSDWGGAPLKAGGGSDNDIVLAKYDRNGTHLWSQRFGSAFNEVAGGLAVDPSGFVTITGSFDQAIDFGKGLVASAGESDIFVARFDPDGKIVWANTFGAVREDIGFAIAADSSGNLVVSGWFQQTVDFGGGPKASYGNRDVFVVKFDAQGHHLWSTSFGDRDHDQARTLALTGNGRPVVAGIYRFDLKVASTLHSVQAPGDKAPPPDIFVTSFQR